VIGNEHFDRLIVSAPVNFDGAKVDWPRLAGLLERKMISPSDIVAVSWCSFGLGDIEALMDEPALAMIHHGGVLSSTGERKISGQGVDHHEIDFRRCRRITKADTADEHGFGKYCIEFLGTGGLLMGRLQWSWWTRPFWRSRARILATAAERDRILSLIQAVAP
jgi:hypothetical protein